MGGEHETSRMPSFIQNGAGGSCDCLGGCVVGKLGAEDTKIGNDELGLDILLEVAI